MATGRKRPKAASRVRQKMADFSLKHPAENGQK
jgi:hypothetical protein